MSSEPPEPNYDESKVPAYTLPDPLVDKAGGKVTSSAQWTARRRGEIFDDFCQNLYGKVPPALAFSVEERERDAVALGGMARRDQIRLVFHHPETGTVRPDSPHLDLLIHRPADREGVPVFLGLNFWGNHATVDDPGVFVTLSNSKFLPNAPLPGQPQSRGYAASRWPYETIIAAGYAVATAYHGDLAPDDRDRWREGAARWLLPEGRGLPQGAEPGALALWAWGLSRAVDYLQTRRDLNPRRIAVIGHSRLGKVALWCAANDERVKLIVSNDSGCGGAALSRRCFGETFAFGCHMIPHWYCGNFRQYSRAEDKLPVDQHELLALLAPRPVYIASATEDAWADPKGEFLSALEAGPVYRLLGGEGLPATVQPPPDTPVMSRHAGYHLRTGPHNITKWDWERFLEFAARAAW